MKNLIASLFFLSSFSFAGGLTINQGGTGTAVIVQGSGGTGGTGTPSGSNTQFQYNNSSSFGGSSDLTQGTNQVVMTTFTVSSGTVTGNFHAGGIFDVGSTLTGFSGQSRMYFDPSQNVPSLKLYANYNLASGNEIDFINSSGVQYASLSANPAGGGITFPGAGGIIASYGISGGSVTATSSLLGSYLTPGECVMATVNGKLITTGGLCGAGSIAPPNYTRSIITGQQDLTSPGYATTGSIWVDSGHSCTIAASSATAGIELDFNGLFQNTSSSQELLITIYRDAVNLATLAPGVVANAQLAIVAAPAGTNVHFVGAAHFIDVPGDTSTHVYTVKLNGSAGVQFTFNGNNVVSIFTAREITGNGSGDAVLASTQTWTGQNTMKDLTVTGTCTGCGSGGGGGYNMEPATVTIHGNQGITASTLTVTSSATIQALTEGTSIYTAISSSGTITPNALLGNNFELPLTSNITINGPTNPVNNMAVTFHIQQDGATRTITWATGAGNFSFGSDIPAVNLSGGGSKYDYVRAIYNSAANRWNIVSIIRGF